MGGKNKFKNGMKIWIVPGIFQAMQGEDFLSRFSVLFSDTAENVTDFLALRSEARAKMSV